MTKSEIIRRTTKRAGVPDSEAKLFFEMFLKRASFRLKPGDSLNLQNVGFFQLRKGKLRHSEEDSSAVNEFMIYSPHLKYESHETFIFNIPLNKEEDYHPVDLYFSLSFGKPVIPLKGVKTNEFFIPPSANEQRRLFETKIERLLINSEIIENQDAANSILVLDPETYIQQSEIQEITISDDTKKIEEEVKDALTKDYGEVPWDFGQDLSRQIEEDSILDFDRDGISSSFDHISPLTPEEKETEQETNNEIDDNDINRRTIKKDLDEVERIGNFERVKSITSEILPKGRTGLTRSEMDLSWDFSSTAEIDKEEIEKNISEISQTLYKTSVANDPGGIEKTYEEQEFAELQEEDEEVRPGLQTAEIESSFYNDKEIEATDDHETDKDDMTSIDVVPPEPQFESIDRDYKKRRSNAGFILTIGVIAIIGIAVLLYYQSGSKLFSSSSVSTVEQKTNANSAPVKIERNYQVPVNYPYNKDNPVEKRNPIDQQVYEDKKTDISSEVKEGTANLVKAQELTDGTKVKEYIFKYPEGYFVQISSWKSKRRAESHAEHFRSLGYHSFIDRSTVSGEVYYRVKVGKFSNISEAENFQIKNINQ